MKFNHLFIFVFLLALSCEKNDDTGTPTTSTLPTASFSYKSDDSALVTFSNTSKDATSYEWDFGDNSAKNTEKAPIYRYAKAGNYKVVLKAFNKDGNKSTEQEVTATVIQQDLADIDKAITDFLTKYNLPGASFAIAQNEKLVYSKGYGVANKSTGEKITPQHVLRIASTSKAYTGMAIMKLIQQGKLKHTDFVFGAGTLLGTKYGTKAYTSTTKQITVSQLLQNTSGFFVNASKADLINSREELDNDKYMTWLLDNSVQEFTPGSAYHYVNVNFFVASVIVEQISGMKFMDYVKKEILDPIGDTETQLGQNQKKLSNEVAYYGQGALAGSENNFNLERYLGAGALVSNARSLLKFACALDSKAGRKDLLEPANQSLFSTTTKQSNWGHGLGVWLPNKLFMYGSLPGTRSGWIINTQTGISVAIIFNGNLDYTNATTYEPFVFAVQDLLTSVSDKARTFQPIDLF